MTNQSPIIYNYKQYIVWHNHNHEPIKKFIGQLVLQHFRAECWGLSRSCLINEHPGEGKLGEEVTTLDTTARTIPLWHFVMRKAPKNLDWSNIRTTKPHPSAESLSDLQDFGISCKLGASSKKTQWTSTTPLFLSMKPCWMQNHQTSKVESWGFWPEEMVVVQITSASWEGLLTLPSTLPIGKWVIGKLWRDHDMPCFICSRAIRSLDDIKLQTADIKLNMSMPQILSEPFLLRNHLSWNLSKRILWLQNLDLRNNSWKNDSNTFLENPMGSSNGWKSTGSP